MNELTILKKIEAGEMTAEQALISLKQKPFEDLGYAKVDLHRHTRQGATEVIYGEGKTIGQIRGIADSLKRHGQGHILVTRVSKEKGQELMKDPDFTYFETPRLGVYGGLRPKEANQKDRPLGTIAIACAGTSDLPVAEEAAFTAEFYGNPVLRLYDVGVAGIERLLSHTEELMRASVVITVAGMEGALASVVGGLVSCPVIAVPTSIGYGASFNGLAAMLAMMNSCASGVTVVNIDNGFGAAFSANRINRMHRIEGTSSGTEPAAQPLDTKSTDMRAVDTQVSARQPSTVQSEAVLSPDASSPAGLREEDTVVELTCNVDDMTGSQVSDAIGQLLKDGAKDAFATSAIMKKERLGFLLTVLAAPKDEERMKEKLFACTTTIGVRSQIRKRAVLRREERTEETSAGPVHFKDSFGYGTVREKAEAEDLQAASRRLGKPVEQIRQMITDERMDSEQLAEPGSKRGALGTEESQ